MKFVHRSFWMLGCLTISTFLLGCDLGSPVIPIQDVEDIPDIGTTRPTPSMGAAPAAAEEKPKIDFGTTTPVFQREKIYLAGQPAEKDFQKIADAGVTRVISLCAEGEVKWDEKAAVEAAGMKFYHFPVASPDDLTPELFENVRTLLAESDDNPTLLHCKGAVRAGAAFVPYWAVNKKRGVEGAMRDVSSMKQVPGAWINKAALYANELVEKSSTEDQPSGEDAGEGAEDGGSAE